MCEYTNLQCARSNKKIWWCWWWLWPRWQQRGEVCEGRSPDTCFIKFRYCSLPLAWNETDGQRPPSTYNGQTVVSWRGGLEL